MLVDGLADRLAGRLDRGRAAAEASMTLTLQAYAPAARTKGPDGMQTQTYTPLSTTPGKVQGAGGQAGGDPATRYVTVAGKKRPVVVGGLHIPIGVEVPVAGDDRGEGWEYEVTAIGPLDDPALLGRRYLVVGVPAKSFATARRLDVVEV